MKTSIQIPVTPLFVKSLEAAITAMESYDQDQSLINEAKKQDCVVGEICRAALENNRMHLAMIKDLVNRINEQFSQ